MEEPGKLLGDCGLRHQQDADGAFKKEDTGNIQGDRRGNSLS
jgi:hypothetical protein